LRRAYGPTQRSFYGAYGGDDDLATPQLASFPHLCRDKCADLGYFVDEIMRPSRPVREWWRPLAAWTLYDGGPAVMRASSCATEPRRLWMCSSHQVVHVRSEGAAAQQCAAATRPNRRTLLV